MLFLKKIDSTSLRLCHGSRNKALNTFTSKKINSKELIQDSFVSRDNQVTA